MWLNPYAVPDAADNIRVPDLETPGWSENLLTWAHDGASNISIFVHMSRLTPDPTLWEGVIAVTLPEGMVLVSRSIGESARSAFTGQLGFDCVQPNRRWHLHYNGVAQATTSDALSESDELADARVALKVELLFDALHPVWALGGEAKDQDWAHFHTQQGGRFSGFITVKDSTFWIECNGLRDHSVGPRDYTGLLGNFWSCCVFPSGKTFMAFKVWSEAIPKPLSCGFMASGQQVRDIRVVEAPTLLSTSGHPRDVKIVIEDDGRQETILGHGTNSITFHLTRPIGMIFGYRAIDDKTCIDTHCPMRYEWNGEVGYGWLERIRRVEHLNGTAPALG